MNTRELLSIDLNVAYGQQPVLREMTLSLDSGEILGLVGHSLRKEFSGVRASGSSRLQRRTSLGFDLMERARTAETE